jgi:phenylalanyl-tRNA synthetase beta chain
MKISLNWLKQFGGQGLAVPVDELVKRIGAQLGGVDHVENLGEKYQGIVIAKVVKCDDHPDADRLHVCTLDDGGVVPDVKRVEKGYVQVVCGAANVREGLLVAWLPPGSTVPESVGKDPFVLEARELRGVVSNGMLASPKELALGDDHDGILEIDPAEWSPNQAEIKPGADFAQTFGLDDTVIDIENKMFTHRPDCFGMLGVAREIAGISGKQFTSPNWYTDAPEFPSGEGLSLEVVNETPALVPRLLTLVMKDVTIKPSPLWLQCALMGVGAKPINNVVDVTNYIMLMTAQPTHAYDYDKLRGHKLVARTAKPGEQAALLNHKTYELDPADVVIADGEGPIGLAGIMGGGDSEVTETTKNIVLECANFDMYSVRRSSMRHGVFTDALTRFNKGQSPLQNAHVLHLLMQSIQDVAGGEVAGQVTDINSAEGREWVHPPVPVTTEFINARLGLELSAEDMKTLLENVEFSVAIADGKLTVTAPFWRTDIEKREDVVEEIGRLYGYDHLPLELPRRSIVPAHKDELLELKANIRHELRKAGANEVLTYSFVHENLLDKAGQDKAQAFGIGNAISPDLQYFRLSLVPSLLSNVHGNIKSGYDEFALFELGKSHDTAALDEDGLPFEFDKLALVFAAQKTVSEGAAYFQAKRLLLDLSQSIGIQLEFVPLTAHASSTDAPFELNRSATIRIKGQEQGFGVIGEFSAKVLRGLKLPAKSAGFELEVGALIGATSSAEEYTPLSRFPAVTQDMTLKISTDVAFGQLDSILHESLERSVPSKGLLRIEPIGIYQKADDTEHTQVSFRISLASYERTLTDAEVNTLLEAAAAAAKAAVGAERI